MSTEKRFASQADQQQKSITFERLSDHAYAYTAEGDPNTGIVIGDDAVLDGGAGSGDVACLGGVGVPCAEP
jgi:hypothetical protein